MAYFNRADIDAMEKRYRIKLINSLSGFKSVNLLGTISTTGQHNLCIISSAFHVGANPPLMGFILRNNLRDTYRNLTTVRHFTINHVTADFYQAAHQTSARYPVGVSEFEAVGLTPELLDGFRVPYVKESPIKIGLDVKKITPIELNTTFMIIGEIVALHFDKSMLWEDGYLDIEQAGSIICSSLDSYHTTQRIHRLSYAKPDRPLTVIAKLQSE